MDLKKIINSKYALENIGYILLPPVTIIIIILSYTHYTYATIITVLMIGFVIGLQYGIYLGEILS